MVSQQGIGWEIRVVSMEQKFHLISSDILQVTEDVSFAIIESIEKIISKNGGEMAQLTSIILAGFGFLWLLVAGGFTWVSWREREPRATRIAIVVTLVGAAIFFLAAVLPNPIQWVILSVMFLALIAALILFLLPIGKVEIGNDIPTQRFDERTIMFARYDLQPGSPNYEEYYSQHPEHEIVDDHIRALPGLFSPKAKLTNPFHTAAMFGGFRMINALWDVGASAAAKTEQPLTPEQMTAYIIGITRYFGALDVGITKLQPYHVYSHTGRGPGIYGEEIEIQHTYAIAFTVEMDFEMVGTGPNSPATLESAHQYAEAARVAVQLANTIGNLGASARAHMDGNYQVIAPLVARDAGLGEIGRMTLLMTPKEGPRVRLGVVTTDLALIPTPRKPNVAVIDFCNICKKCAENCPSNSIPFDERVMIDGAMRWKLKEETCFRYWSVVGTDCGRCMAVCPYSHPDNLAHNLVRWGIVRSGAFRRFALWMDDLFYGKEPIERTAPEWTQVQ